MSVPEAKYPLKIYRSSAGSGKTYTLVKEYISIVLGAEHPTIFKEILAITFTNKAANEMKERVLETLHALWKGNDTNLLMDYQASLALGPEEIKEKSGVAYRNILHHYGHFNILTIDKFVHRIIRSFTRELGLEMNFEVESDVDMFLHRSIDLLLSKVGEEEELTNYLVQFSEQLIEDSETGDIEKQLLRLTEILKKEKGQASLASLQNLKLSFFTELRSKSIASHKVTVKRLEENIALFNQFLQDRGVDYTFFKGGARSGWGKFINSVLIDGFEGVKLTDKSIETLSNQLDQSGWYKKSDEDWVSSNGMETQEFMSTILENIQNIGFYKEFNSQLIGFSLLNSVYQLLSKVKEDSNIVFINDFNKIISEIVKNEPAPFIYEKIGGRYRHYLIDEFQDTSQLQWTNLVPLVYDSLAEGKRNLIVGDAKQAIYRWRDGNVQQFISLPEVGGEFVHLREINRIFESAARVDHLANNYRSSKSVVEFNNRLFKKLAEGEDEKIQLIYDGVEQQVTKSDEGYVSYDILDEEEGAVEQSILDTAYQYVLNSKNDGYLDGDIAILVRSKREGGVIAEFLKNKGMPVISMDSIVLGSSEEVQFIVSFLLGITNLDNEHAIVRCLSYLTRHSSLTDVFDQWRIPHPEKEQYTIGINFEGYLKQCYKEFNTAYFHSLNLYDKICYVSEQFGINRYDPYVDQLLNTVHHYLRRNSSNVSSFIEYFERKKNSIPVNLGNVSNAIQVMTIHKSKGLQFPVVLVPFARWVDRPPGAGENTWIQHEKLEEMNLPLYIAPLSKSRLKHYDLEEVAEKEKGEIILDNLNLYYVAFTRAKDRLHIISSEGKKKNSNVYGKINELIKLEEGFNEGERRLEKGQLVKKTENPVARIKPEKGEQLTSWRNKLKLSLDREAFKEEFRDITEVEFGNAVHEILSELLSVEQLEQCVSAYFRVRHFSPDVKEKVINQLTKVLDLPQVKKWFEPGSDKVFNEKEIITSTGEFYRPDKVLVNDQEAIVIDFKTGEESNRYEKQINQYARLLQEMGYTGVKKYLLYINSAKIVEV